MTERQKVSKFLKAIKKDSPQGFYILPLSDIGGVTHKKPADIVGCFRGRFFAVEFKIGNENLRDSQIAGQADIVAAGGIYIVGRFHPKNELVFSSFDGHTIGSFIYETGKEFAFFDWLGVTLGVWE